VLIFIFDVDKGAVGVISLANNTPVYSWSTRT